jgi:hypothetical protein
MRVECIPGRMAGFAFVVQDAPHKFNKVKACHRCGIRGLPGRRKHKSSLIPVEVDWTISSTFGLMQRTRDPK